MNKILLLTILVLLLRVAPASSHVEKGYMPDSVAEMEYRILLEFKPEDNVTRSLLGMALLRQNKLSEAEKEFRILLKSDPKNFDGLDSLGLILFNQKRFPEALQHLQTAIALRPDDIMVHLHLGMTLISIGQPESARSILANGIRLLNTHAPSPVKEQQLSYFLTATAALPTNSGTTFRK